jgi:hypothetical protein
MRQALSKKLCLSIMSAALLSSALSTTLAYARSKGFKLEARAFYIGKPYDSLRPMLESSGWRPEYVHGPYPDYPEIHCSLSGQCVGYWRKKDLHEIYVDVNVNQEPFITEALQSDSEYRRENGN